ncbi:hypothetical protein PR202_ga24445 [Eleusine coracana subsp. coracana]|uniref:Serpin domain-containing protein n=1 Tax=Eleusine coracana subsp. coracana TaxID=191504 RepID=A0AAV5D6S4_ELECO|nr:hypothetical protein PR202_ga24445 [Eleusine coracana subsp. coracana]
MWNHMPKGYVTYVPVGEFCLPKFKLTFERDIVDDLKALGLYLPFDKEKANMIGMHMKGGVGVDSVRHKAVIEMNEEGTEAAAVTMEYCDEGNRYTAADSIVTQGIMPPPQRPWRTGEDVSLSRRVAATFLLMTMADFSDQSTASMQSGSIQQPTASMQSGAPNVAAFLPQSAAVVATDVQVKSTKCNACCCEN